MKAVTLNQLLERLKQVDEVALLELLEITSSDIVDRFTDYIEDNKEALSYELEELYGDSND